MGAVHWTVSPSAWGGRDAMFRAVPILWTLWAAPSRRNLLAQSGRLLTYADSAGEPLSPVFSTHGLRASLLPFGPLHAFPLLHGFAFAAGTSLARGFPFRARALHTCPHSSVITQYRNLHLLSIDYGFRPRLRPRLTQGRSALPWKPWIFGLEDSHLHLATHSGILSP